MNKLVSFKNLSQKLSKTITPPKFHHNSFKYFHTFSKTPLIHHKWHYCHSPKTYGVFSNPVFSKYFPTSISHFKKPINSFVGPRILFLRTQLPKDKLSPWFVTHKRKWSSWSQGYSADDIVLGLIVANAAVFVLWRVLDRGFMYRNFTISVDNLKSGHLHTLITSAFSHIDLGHIASNMIGLYFFGSNIGRCFGPEFLLKLYLAGAVVGSIFYVVHHALIVKMFQKQGTFGRDPSKVPGLGASGAVNAILLLDIFLFPKKTILLDFFIPVPAVLLGIFLIGQDVLRMLQGDQQISGSAHLGGAVVAAAAWLRIKKGRGFRF